VASNVIYLFGAGASADAGLPMSSGLTEKALHDLNNESPKRPGNFLVPALNFVIAMMTAHKTRAGGRADEFPDIESVVSAVELLANRPILEISPFVRDWDPQISSLDSMLPRLQVADWSAIRADEPMWDRRFESELRQFVAQQIAGDHGGHIFDALRNRLMIQLKEFLFHNDPSEVEYLKPLVELGRSGTVTVASLNYDLIVEEACKSHGVNISTGTDRWSEEWVLSWADSGVNLIKLHGSIGWTRAPYPTKLKSSELDFNHFGIREIDPGVDTLEVPLVVYGRREKLRPEGPFLDLRSAFVDELRRSTHLVVVGYSFSDPHINELVQVWLGTDVNRKLFVVDPGFPTEFDALDRDFRRDLWTQLVKGEIKDGKFCILHARMLVLRESATSALPKLCVPASNLDSLLADSI
jgi:hypothetical protein